MSLPIAVDAMGGDSAPGAVVEGARQAAAGGIAVTLVGRRAELGEADDLPVVEASEVIAMDEDPAQGVRRKKDSSLVRAAEAVRDARAGAMVSAGNTGAAMAAALLRMGRIKGVSRPAIATPIPIPGSSPTVLLDAGANAEVQPEWLVQFAQMGSVFARHRFAIDSPRVGLLSIGEEPGKGNLLVKETHALLADAPGVRFIGNVEGRDVMTDDVDVVVTDGFTGNVVLKTLEGAALAIVAALRAALGADPSYAAPVAALARALDPLYRFLDPETYGGAMLLGVEGVCIISHGSSSPRAILNAIRVAREMVDAKVVDQLRTAVSADDGR
jgi:glycerol-3-phosphate acyltransferase PlsX